MHRILFLSHYALPHLGGIEVVVDALAKELVRAGHEVTHLCSDGVRAGEGVAPSAYQCIRVPAWNVLERRAGVPWPIFAPRLLPALKREVAQADVIHAHGLLYLNSVLGLRAGRSTRAVRVLTEHVGHVRYANPILDGLERLALRGLGRMALRSAEGIVVLNDKVKAEMSALGATADIVCIRNGVDHERYRPADQAERARLRQALGWDDTPRLLFVGRLVAKKGVHLAVAAAARLDGRARLVVVGPGTMEPAPNVEVLGPLPQDRVAELYRAADAFLLPSRGEGFPLTAQEAMASGLPVVLGDDPAYAPYLVDEGARTARLDGEALAAAIAPLLDATTRSRAAEAALRKARADFSWQAAAQAHLAFYDELRARRRSSPQS